MRSRGPSPLVPFLMVGVLGLVVFGSTLMSAVEYVQPLFEASDEEGAMFPLLMVLPLFLLLLIHFISSRSPTFGTYRFASRHHSSSYDAEGYGLGSILLLVLFFVLCNVFREG